MQQPKRVDFFFFFTNFYSLLHIFYLLNTKKTKIVLTVHKYLLSKHKNDVGVIHPVMLQECNTGVTH